jgi:hypothetical protein
MPPRGVKKGTKRARQYEHIKDSQKERGASEDRAEEIAARTVNKERARSGESRQRSRTDRTKGRTRDQLYNEAKKLNIEGRSNMNKSELERAVDRRK